MKPLLHTPLGEIQDESILHVPQDLCNLRNWRLADFEDYTLFEFLEVVVNDNPATFSLDRLPLALVVDQKLGKLQHHGFYQVCKELNHGDTLEPDAKTPLFEFLKKRFTRPTPPTVTPPSLSPHDLEVRIIKQRRDNAS